MARRRLGRFRLAHDRLGAALVVVWGVFLVGAFRPFRGVLWPSPATAWAGSFAWANMRELALRVGVGQAVVAVWAVAVAGLGTIVLPVVAPRLKVDRPDRRALGLGLGFGLGTLLWLGLGLAGLWLPRVAWVVTAIGWWLVMRGSATREVRPKRVAVPVSAGPGRWAVVLFGCLAVMAVAIVVAGSALPETAPDPLIYHLALPEIFTAEHRIVPSTQIFHASLPMGAPMHYGWMLLLGGEPAVRAWRGWVFVVILWLLHRIASRAGSWEAGWIAAGVFASLPQTHFLGSATYVDLDACALGLLACLAIQSGGRRRIVLGGVLAGAACAVKLTAVFLVPGLIVAVRPRRPLLIVKRAVVVGLAVGVLMAPWWIRNEISVGNPIQPFAEKWFPPYRPMPPYYQEVLAAHTESRVLRGWKMWPAFPWLDAKGMNEETQLGPVFLLGVPWLILSPPVATLTGYAWVAGIAAVCWAVKTNIPRYAMTVWALLTVLIASSLWQIGGGHPTRQRWLSVFCASLLAIFGVEVLLGALPRAANVIPVWLGRESPLSILDRLPNSYLSVARGTLRLPRGARVLLVGEWRGAHWPVAVINHSPYDIKLADEILASSHTGAEAAKRMRQRAGWVYVGDAETGRIKYTLDFPLMAVDARAEHVAAEVWRFWMDEESRSGSGVLWRIRRTPRTRGPWPAVPLTFNAAGLREAYGPFTAMSFGTPAGGTTTIRIAK